MSESYRLVFRGEVLEGQHPAVVRKRLGQTAGFDESVLEKLFSGKPVVVKREADTATAARFQALFKKAGARLRVLPVEADEPADPTQVQEDPLPSKPAAGAPAPSSSGLQLLPAGTDVLREEERSRWQPREVDTSGLSLEKTRFLVAEDSPAPAGPDVSHLTIADLGADLGPRREARENPVQAPDLEVAEVGADLAPHAAAAVPVVDIAELSFEVAPTGADLDQREPRPVPAPPDTSYLGLIEQV